MNRDVSQHVPAFVRVTGPPNSNFLIGYPGIAATMVSMAQFVQKRLESMGLIIAVP